VARQESKNLLRFIVGGSVDHGKSDFGSSSKARKSGSQWAGRWREKDSNPRSPARRLTQTRSNGDVQHPCAAVGRGDRDADRVGDRRLCGGRSRRAGGRHCVAAIGRGKSTLDVSAPSSAGRRSTGARRYAAVEVAPDERGPQRLRAALSRPARAGALSRGSSRHQRGGGTYSRRDGEGILPELCSEHV
jgi:hypothetical protein